MSDDVTVRTEAVLIESDNIMAAVRTADGGTDLREFTVLIVGQPGTYIVARRPDEAEVLRAAEPSS